MTRKLKAYVHVVDEDNQPVVLEPGDELPSWAEDQVTNPKAFADEDDESSDAAPAKRAPRKAAAKRPARGKATTKPDPVPSPDAAASSDGGNSDGAAGDGASSGDGSAQ